MKKMKRVVPVEASPYAVYGDAKTRLKHHSLMQDYEELQKETEDMRNQLQRVKHKKLTLLAEVRFLRERYKYLIKNQPSNPLLKTQLSQQLNLQIRRKSTAKERNSNGKEGALRHPITGFEFKRKESIYNGKEAGLRHPVPGFELKQKERIYNGEETTLRQPVSGFELKQKQSIYSGRESALRNPDPVFDLNQKERIQHGKGAAMRSPVPTFDLNQISREEEELQVNGEPMRIEEQKNCLIRGGFDEQQNDMKLSFCRNSGNGSNRAGKRKISWQDQVALKV